MGISIFLFILMITDLVFNSVLNTEDVSCSGSCNEIAIALFGVQILVQICAVGLLFLLLSGTILFRIGLIGVLTKEFSMIKIIIPIYTIMSIVSGGYRVVSIVYIHIYIIF